VSCTFFVEGIPGPQGSKVNNGYGGVREASKKVKPWRAAVQKAAIAHQCALHIGPVAVDLTFVMKRPKSLPKTKPTPPLTKRNGDIDKLARSTLDGLTGYAYQDDSQVTSLTIRKRTAEIDEPTGAKIAVSSDTAAWVPPTRWSITEARLQWYSELREYLDDQGIDLPVTEFVRPRPKAPWIPERAAA
jgi:crossover junction endodeoxyribonuclease RusA